MATSTQTERPSIWQNNRCCSRCRPFESAHVQATTLAQGVDLVKRARRVNVSVRVTDHEWDLRFFAVTKKEAIHELSRDEKLWGSGAKVSLLLDNLDGRHTAFIG